MSQTEIEEITVHRRSSDPRDDSWHKAVTGIVYYKFGGKPTLWNWAWIEYHVFASQVDALADVLVEQGYRVTIGDDDDDDDE